MSSPDKAPTEPRSTTPLEERLITLIEANGAISVEDYMADALLHPHEGYYTSRTPIGQKGDFTTSPEISQIFGELIGLWLLQSWEDMGAPEAFNLVELGPGRGVLMADILRVAKLKPEFLKAAHIWLVETSGRMRHEQRKRLQRIAVPLDWADSYDEVPDAPMLVVGNELFDCLPIRQFEMTDLGWRERMVNVKDGALTFSTAFAPPLASVALPTPDTVAIGDIYELGAAGENLAACLAERLKTLGGRALIIDYGHLKSGVGETLQAVKDHQPWPVLQSPGSADISAHVNFERLQMAAFEAGAEAHGPVTQGSFLDRLGLAMRVARLCADKPQNVREEIEAGAFRIAATSQMGEIFKVLSISAPGLPCPAGFSPL